MLFVCNPQTLIWYFHFHSVLCVFQFSFRFPFWAKNYLECCVLSAGIETFPAVFLLLISSLRLLWFYNHSTLILNTHSIQLGSFVFSESDFWPQDMVLLGETSKGTWGGKCVLFSVLLWTVLCVSYILFFVSLKSRVSFLVS